jgi:hypothetical protein
MVKSQLHLTGHLTSCKNISAKVQRLYCRLNQFQSIFNIFGNYPVTINRFLFEKTGACSMAVLFSAYGTGMRFRSCGVDAPDH